MCALYAYLSYLHTCILISAWLSGDQIRANIIKTNVWNIFEYAFKFFNYSTINNEHNQKDLFVQLKSQQRCTFDNHK
jgi:hypothetical protein